MDTSNYKERLKTAFSQSASTYHEKALVQKQAADTLLSMIDCKQETGTLWEIGCGSGFLSESILKQYPQHRAYISDLSEGMLDLTKKNCHEIVKKRVAETEFLCIDGEQKPPFTYNLCISGLAFQLFENLERSLQRIWEGLEVNGEIYFSLLLDESFREWREVCNKVKLPFTRNPLPKEEHLRSVLEKLDPHSQVHIEEIPSNSSTAQEFFKRLKEIGTAIARDPIKKLDANDWKVLFNEFEKMPFPLRFTYQIAYVSLKKREQR